MKVLTRRTRAGWRRAVITVGVFDGVHLAHQRLLRRTMALARRTGSASVAVTFHPDPYHVLAPQEAPPALMSLQARLRHLAASGLDATVVVQFTRAFARIRAERFVREFLVRRLRAAAIVVGDNFTFGQGRHGDVRTLRAAAAAAGARVFIVPPVMRGGSLVSASRIRRLIQAGKLRAARALLGHAPTLGGRVVQGAGRGRRLGFPTANIRLQDQVVPPHGVYAVRARLEPGVPGARPWPAVMNLGTRPTFGGGAVSCEVHVLGRRGAWLGRTLSLELVQRLRGEQCFPSLASLQHQIRRDIARARQRLARR